MLKLHRNIRSNEQQTIANINCTVTLHHFMLHFILARARVVPYLIQFIFGDFFNCWFEIKIYGILQGYILQERVYIFFSFFSSRININEEFVILNSGQWARVYRCRSRSTGTLYAAKYSSRNRFNADCSAELRHEIALLSLCSQSPCVVRLHDVYETPKEIILVME